MTSPDGFTRVDDVGDWCRGWIAPTPAYMRRASHVLIDRDDVAWIIDPVAGPPLTDAVGDRHVGGVIQLMDRHNRHCAAVAAHYDVPHLHTPSGGDGTPFESVPVVTHPRFGWLEVALWWPERATLVVADALGTSDYHRAPGESVGVPPLLRAVAPPRMLTRYPARHVLFGHGEGLHAPDAAEQVTRAVDEARAGIAPLGLRGAKAAGRAGAGAVRRLLGR